jgi:hypothetical protein
MPITRIVERNSKLIGNIRDVYLFGELKVYACPIGGTFFDEQTSAGINYGGPGIGLKSGLKL